MPVLKQPEKMTDSELEAMINFHQSTMVMFQQRGERSTARGFGELVDKYQSELKRRTSPDPEVWDSPDR